MAMRLGLPARAQLPRQWSCPRSNFTLNIQARQFKFSARLEAARPPNQPIRVRSQQQQPPPKPPRSSASPKPSSASNTGTSSPQAETLDVLFQQRKWPLIGAGVTALALGLYVSMILTSSSSDKTHPQPATPSPSLSGACCDDGALPTPTGLPSTLSPTSPPSPASHQTATSFDASLDLPEYLTGIIGLRRALAARARGHVLEVAVGTGRNLGYYDWSEIVSATQDDDEARARRQKGRVMRLVEASTATGTSKGGGPTVKEALARGVGSLEGEVLSYTGVDLSGDMIGVARDRVREAVPGLKQVMRRKRAEPMPRLGEAGASHDDEIVVVDALGSRIRLVLADAMRGLPLPPQTIASPPASQSQPQQAQPPPQKYDTILQTFGLCSVSSPATLLAHMASVLQPDTGRILLLEHGRGEWAWINRLLDEYAPRHFAKYGCWWNRDIEAIVREAAAAGAVPGLEVVRVERPLVLRQAKTLLLIELRVRSQPQGEGKGGPGGEEQGEVGRE